MGCRRKIVWQAQSCEAGYRNSPIHRESGHEHFNGSVVIPISMRRGQVVQMYAREITPGFREARRSISIPPGPHRGVWNEEALAVSKEIILCEALIDALTFWCAGYRHVTASYGINGFTDEHRAAFKKYGTKKSFANDRDDAGERAAQELAEELIATGIGVTACSSQEHGRQRIRAQGAARGEEPGDPLEQGAAWLGKASGPQSQ